MKGRIYHFNKAGCFFFNPETKLLFAIQKMWVLIRHRKGLIATNCLRKFENCKASPTHHLYTFLANKKIK